MFSVAIRKYWKSNADVCSGACGDALSLPVSFPEAAVVIYPGDRNTGAARPKHGPSVEVLNQRVMMEP